MSVEIICPLYNASSFLLCLISSLKKQREVKDIKINFVLTDSSDDTESILIQNKMSYNKVSKNDFSHSYTREQEAMKSKCDILVFITQDVVIEDELWLKKLITPIENKECAATYSRQISKFDNIEKYTREKNYPAESFFVSKKNLEKKGLKTFFFSDASSAINANIFKELNGYDGKKLPTNEDMYIAYKLIMNGYKIGYVAESVVYHSHNFSLKEVYKRYKLTGQFFKENKYLDQFGTNKSGGGLAKYILKRALQEFNISVLLRYPFDMAARLIGMKVGKK